MSRAVSGLCRCCLPAVPGRDLRQEREARRRSREIDAMLKRDWREKQLTEYILMTGASESGKATFIKQMRIIDGQEFNHTELLEFRKTIYINIIEGIQTLIYEKGRLEIPWQNSVNEQHETLMRSIETWRTDMEPCTFQLYVDIIDSIWKDSGIQETYNRRSEFHLCESVKYFIDNIDHIGQLNYLPSNQDILYTHKRFTKMPDLYEFCDRSIIIINTLFLRHHVMRRVVGPEIINSIFFFAASSQYDQVIIEDNQTSCLYESLTLFKNIINNRYFLSCSIILFLNKTDLLVEKLQKADIRKNFPEFQGDPHRLEDVQEFLVQCYSQIKTESNNMQPFFHHFITAVDTENIRLVLNAVKDRIVKKNLKHIMLQ